MEKIIEQALNQDPRAFYLKELGSAIKTLSEKEKDGYWFNNKDCEKTRKEWIDELHKKAMEVIKTLK